MFEYLCLHLSQSNSEKHALKNKLKTLTGEIINTEKQVLQMKTMISNLSLTNFEGTKNRF